VESFELKLDLAWSLANLAHYNQLDKQEKPYIDHIQRVYLSCAHLSEEQRLAAILHDIPEDGSAIFGGESPEHFIYCLFGFTVGSIVEALTRPSNWSYEKYIQCLVKCPEAILIKLADIEDNLDETRGPIPEDLKKRYIKAKEYLKLYIAP
jgi:(p)ppGpp synthase/HD superfamily hydrolase